MHSAEIIESGIAAGVFAIVFLAGGYIFPRNRHERHALTSFFAGMSAAYVFVRVLPELTELREALSHTVWTGLPYEGAIVYFVALIGFMAFYGLNELEVFALRRSVDIDPHVRAYRIHMTGFGVYVWLVSYLLIRGLEHSLAGKELYTAALAVHLLATDNSLREEHGALYQKRGRYWLAMMAIAGWLVGAGIQLHTETVALLVAFVSGGIIVNAMIQELPPEHDGQFVPFMTGGVIYGAVLILMA